MQDWLAREGMLLGREGVERLENAAVAVFGLGGVGSYTTEALARAGVGSLLLVDGDVVSDTNRNRQLAALTSTVGRPKAAVMAERVRDINPACRVVARTLFYLPGEDGAPGPLLSLFSASDTMLSIGIPALRIISVSFCFAGVAIVFSSVFQALGDGMLSLVMSAVRQLLLLLPCAFVLAKLGGLDAVWFSFLIAEVASVTLAVVFYRSLYNKKIRHI